MGSNHHRDYLSDSFMLDNKDGFAVHAGKGGARAPFFYRHYCSPTAKLC